MCRARERERGCGRGRDTCGIALDAVDATFFGQVARWPMKTNCADVGRHIMPIVCFSGAGRSEAP